MEFIHLDKYFSAPISYSPLSSVWIQIAIVSLVQLLYYVDPKLFQHSLIRICFHYSEHVVHCAFLTKSKLNKRKRTRKTKTKSFIVSVIKKWWKWKKLYFKLIKFRRFRKQLRWWQEKNINFITENETNLKWNTERKCHRNHMHCILKYTQNKFYPYNKENEMVVCFFLFLQQWSTIEAVATSFSRGRYILETKVFI